MRENILQVRLFASAPPLVSMSSCSGTNSQAYNHNHRYILVEERMHSKAPASHYYICKSCGHEKPLEHACVVEIDHQHDYRTYRGCTNGFYILRCTHYGCESFLRIFNSDSQTCTNNGKRHLEED
jgi:hypothetical protein